MLNHIHKASSFYCTSLITLVFRRSLRCTSSTHGNGTASFKCQVAPSLEVLVCAAATVMDIIANGLCSVSSVDVGLFAGRHVPFMILRHRHCDENVALRDVGIHKVLQFCRRLRAVARHCRVVHKNRAWETAEFDSACVVILLCSSAAKESFRDACMKAARELMACLMQQGYLAKPCRAFDPRAWRGGHFQLSLKP